jgi:hypothetical protein
MDRFYSVMEQNMLDNFLKIFVKVIILMNLEILYKIKKKIYFWKIESYL